VVVVRTKVQGRQGGKVVRKLILSVAHGCLHFLYARLKMELEWLKRGEKFSRYARG